jgi:hypothetical protein
MAQLEVVLETPEVKRNQAESLVLFREAQLAVVESQETYDAGAEAAQKIRRIRKFFDGLLNPLIRAQAYAHRVALQAKKDVDKPLCDAELIWKQKLTGYEVKQRQIEEETRRRKDAEHEQRQREMAEAMAADAKAKGATKGEQAAIVEEVVSEPPPPVVSTFTRSTAVSSRETWTGEVTNFMELVKAVAAKKVGLNVLKVNQSALNGLATANKNQLSVPGVKAVKRIGGVIRT